MLKLLLLASSLVCLSETSIPIEENNAIAIDYTEIDVYGMNQDYSSVYHLPLKAMSVDVDGFKSFLLTDNEGSIFLSFDDLVDGGNYIGTVYKTNSGREVLNSLMQSEFTFNYEDVFNKSDAHQDASFLFDEITQDI